MHKFFVFFYYIFLCLWAQASWSQDWKLQDNTQEDPFVSGVVAHIKQKKEAIHNQSDLNFVMDALHNHLPLIGLRIYHENKIWIFDAHIGNKIKKIHYHLNTSILNDALDKVKHKFIGKTDTEEVRNLLIADVLNTSFKEGFPNLKVSLTETLSDRDVELTLTMDEGQPCSVQHITMHVPLEKKYTTLLEGSKTCNINHIERALKDTEEKLKDDGYHEVSLYMDHLTYSQDKSFLFFDVTGSIGKKISYEFYDKTNYIQSVLLNRNEIDSLDVRNSKPHLLGSEIIKHYKNIGYEDVSVNGPIVSEESEKHINYKFEITPGSLYYLNEVVFLDNKYLNHMKLMEALNLSSFWKKALPLNREQFIDGLDNIQALYEKEGFWDIKVETPRESRNEQAITFTLPIKEGKQRLLNSLVLKGLTPDEEVEVRASWFTPTGNPIDKNLILELQKTIQEYLFNKGFLQAKTDVEFKITHHKSQNIYIDVVITAQKNKLAYIRKISISGLVHTSEEVVRRELLCAPDTIYSPKAIHKTRNALLGLGIFSSVQLTTAPAFKNSESFDFVDINIELKESDRTQISFGPGYNLLKGLHYITEFNYNNLSGSARKLNLRASVSQEKNQESIYSTDTPQAKLLLGRKIGLGYQEPYLFGYPLTGQLSLSHKATADNIWKFTNMFEASVRYTLKEPLPHATIVPFYNLRFNNDEGTSAQEDLLVATGNSRIGVIGTKFYWDGRDSLSWPTKGLLLNLEVQVAEFFLGGDINYIKWETNVSVYQKLVEDVIGALNLSVAAYENVQEKNKRFGVLPSTERLQAGGQQRVRGFVQPLGPYVVTPTGEAQTPFGGTHRLILKTELRRPFIDHFLGGSLFLDCGNSYFTQNEIDAFEERLSENTIHSNQMPSIENNQSYSLLDLFAHPSFLYEKNYQSYGTSVNFLTPIGAINFALAWPLHEPFGIDCQSRQGCYKRARQGDIWYKKVKAELNIGSEF